MFAEMETVFARPRPFQYYTARDLWTDEHTSKRMLAFHLDENVDVSSRKKDLIERSVDWIVSHFDVGPETKIADFGCGPGLYAARLAQKQAAVLGVDFSKRSIEYARAIANRQSLDIRYVNQDYLEFETTDRFNLILMIMCDFCALSPAQRKKMLSMFFGLLEPGGAVLLDVYSLRAFDQREESTKCEANLLDGFWSPNRYYGFLNTFRYEEEQVVLDKYTLFEPSRTRTIYNWLQYYNPESLERECADNGFMIDELLGDVAGSPFDPDGAEFAVVARRVAS
jgi:SAM-dependent methyltransferase